MKNFKKGIAFLLVLVMTIASCTAAFAYTALKFNDRGSNVQKLQQALKKAGYYTGKVDGIYGKYTRYAVKNYQKSVGLTADGVAGNDTLTRLYEGKTGYSTLTLGSSGDAVRKLQTALKAKGYYKGDIDGEYGASTKAAVIKFQTKIGITADGKAGYKTQNALYNGTSAINTSEQENIVESTTVTVTNQHSLYYGCTGSRVKTLQRALKAAGCYSGNIDGVYGDLVLAAVKKYQSKNGLHADGIAGKATIASLNKKTKYTISTTFVLNIGSTGTEVKKVISFLKTRGYVVPSGSTYDETLQSAVKAWQSANGKTVTGTITEAQYNKIVNGKEDSTI